MKKNLMIGIAFVLIFTHIIPPYNISFANDEVNDCENMDFSVHTIIENDKKIVGTGLPSDQLTVEFNSKNKTEVVVINSSGRFELTVEEEFLEENNLITISNEYYKVETNIADEDDSLQTVPSRQYVECPVLVEQESETESEETLEETSEELESGETLEEATSEEETSESEETLEKEASEEEVSESEEISEEVINDELSDEELAQIEDVVSKSRVRNELIIKELELFIDDITKNETNTIAPFTSLTDVQLLTNVSIEANLNEPADGEQYTMSLNLQGIGAAEVKLVNPDRIVVFHAPDLAGQLVSNDGTASVNVDILPITMADLPALDTALEGLTGTLNGLVSGLWTDISDALPLGISPSLVEVSGLDELNAAIDNLNNLNTALGDVLSYTEDVTYIVNEDGTIVVNFSDGLGKHLESAVTDIVQSALDDVNTAVNNLEINLLDEIPIVGDLLSSLTNDLLLPLVEDVSGALNIVSTGLTNSTIDLTNSLASVQVIDKTNVNLDVLVNNPPGDVSGKIPVFGAGIQDSVIDMALLDSLQNQNTVTFPEPPRFVLTQPENILFNNTEINNGEQKIYRENNQYNIEVIDERPNSNWSLSVQALEPLKTLDDIHSLPDSLFYFEDGKEPKSIENEPVEIAQKDQNDTSDIQNIVWDREEGLLLKTDPINAVAGQKYSTTIEWTLTDGPTSDN